MVSGFGHSWVRAEAPHPPLDPLAWGYPCGWVWEPRPLPAAHTPPLGKLWAQACAAGCRGAGPERVRLALSRVGQRGGGLSMSAARSEHEVSEIIDGLSEQEVSPQS